MGNVRPLERGEREKILEKALLRTREDHKVLSRPKGPASNFDGVINCERI